MPHVSKKELTTQAKNKINKTFTNFLGELSVKEDIHNFFDEFLTETEKIMFAKRLALISMLDQRVYFSEITTILKISPSTVSRIQTKLLDGDYDYLQTVLRDKALKKTLFDYLEAIIDPQFMPSVGKDRWRWLNTMYGGETQKLEKKKYFKDRKK